MALDYKKLKVGDKVRYLGGDSSDMGELTVGKEYVISGVDSRGYTYLNRDGVGRWYVSDYNDHCFELVGDEEKVDKESLPTCKCDCKHESHIVSLAKQVAELTRELTEVKSELYSGGQRVEDDIALLDERLIEVEDAIKDDKASVGDTFITINGSEYIDKLFGGGANE